MSYLVDALKKAERERHRQQVGDIRSLSEPDASGHGRVTGRRMRWIVIALVVCNLGLLFYLLGPGMGTDAAADAPTSEASQPAVAGSASGQAAQSPPSAPSAEDTQRAVRAAAPAAHSAGDNQQRLSSLRLSQQKPGAGSSRGGQVTFATEPLDGGSVSTPRSANAVSAQAPAAEQMGGVVPQVSINGHLYSSVPGRSFILVNGRRYHEGERLAAGPAIESIDVTGATLNYRGRRYHVSGPG